MGYRRGPSLPGVRPWATLSCGAMGIQLRRFLLGAVPALMLWLGVWTALGVLVGIPLEHALGVFQRLILQGGILVGVGVAGYIGFHTIQGRGMPAGQRRAVWLPLTLLIAAGAIASMAAGVLAIGRGLVGDDAATWLDALVVALVLAVVGAVTLVRDHIRYRAPSTPVT